jgi:hypothetical protein
MVGRNLEQQSGGRLGASAAFALGVVTGILLNGAAKRTYDALRRRQWHREHEKTVTYNENIPEPLGRREPAPYAGQPRYGGTGAIGVPTSAAARPTREGEAPESTH